MNISLALRSGIKLNISLKISSIYFRIFVGDSIYW